MAKTTQIRTVERLWRTEPRQETIVNWTFPHGFLPARFVIAERPEAFSVTEILVGLYSQIPFAVPFPLALDGERFGAEAEPFIPYGGEWRVARANEYVTVRLVNRSSEAVDLRCYWRGTLLGELGHRDVDLLTALRAVRHSS